MTDRRSRPTRAEAEAADWFTRLGRKSVTTEALRDFRTWREEPANDAAYQDVEAFWETSGRQAADPEMQRMTEEALARRRPVRRPRGLRFRQWIWVLPIGLLGAGAAVAVGLSVIAPSYTTDRMEQRVILLKDGSRMHLNVASQARIRFSRGERRVELSRGEALFEVAHDVARPFIVIADGAAVRAVGTRFDVRRDADNVRVTLLEGVVQVKDRGAGGWTLRPNQMLTLGAAGGSVAPVATDAALATSWTSGHLIFSQTPLGEAVAEVNRYGKRPIVLQDGELARRQVNGVFNIGDTDGFVRGVSSLFDLEATSASGGEILLRAKTASPAA